MTYDFDAGIEEDLMEKIDRGPAERIFDEARRFANDLSQPHAYIRPPAQPTREDFEVARMVGYKICTNPDTNELFYQPIQQ